jgi:flagellin-like protein
LNFSRRKAVSEVISAVMTLAITMSVLTGVFYIVSSSISHTEKDAQRSNQSYQKRLGSLFSLVFEFTNSSGTYLYFYSYGWEDVSLLAVYLDGEKIKYTTSCFNVKPGSVCFLSVANTAHGTLALDTTGGLIYERV